MNETKLNIMTSAVKILISRGLTIEEALDRYPGLTEADAAVIRDRVSK